MLTTDPHDVEADGWSEAQEAWNEGRDQFADDLERINKRWCAGTGGYKSFWDHNIEINLHNLIRLVEFLDIPTDKQLEED